MIYLTWSSPHFFQPFSVMLLAFLQYYYIQSPILQQYYYYCMKSKSLIGQFCCLIFGRGRTSVGLNINYLHWRPRYCALGFKIGSSQRHVTRFSPKNWIAFDYCWHSSNKNYYWNYSLYFEHKYWRGRSRLFDCCLVAGSAQLLAPPPDPRTRRLATWAQIDHCHWPRLPLSESMTPYCCFCFMTRSDLRTVRKSRWRLATTRPWVH